MTVVLTRRDLDRATCQHPGCDHSSHSTGLALHARCHPSAPLEVWYQDGTLTMRCARCVAVVVVIAVSEGRLVS